MCGIAGQLGGAHARTPVREMIGALTHRGPDGVRVEAEFSQAAVVAQWKALFADYGAI